MWTRSRPDAGFRCQAGHRAPRSRDGIVPRLFCERYRRTARYRGVGYCDERNLTQTPAFRKAAALLPAHWGLHQRMRIHNFYLCDSEPEHAVRVVSPDANRKL